VHVLREVLPTDVVHVLEPLDQRGKALAEHHLIPSPEVWRCPSPRLMPGVGPLTSNQVRPSWKNTSRMCLSWHRHFPSVGHSSGVRLTGVGHILDVDGRHCIELGLEDVWSPLPRAMAFFSCV
jgi:hypothetical protein